jgi:hypothetical protein
MLEEGARGFQWGSCKTVVTSRSAEWASDHTLCSGIAVIVASTRSPASSSSASVVTGTSLIAVEDAGFAWILTRKRQTQQR